MDYYVIKVGGGFYYETFFMVGASNVNEAKRKAANKVSKIGYVSENHDPNSSECIDDGAKVVFDRNLVSQLLRAGE